MIRSMTGFGRASGSLSPRFQASVTAKCVNHRYLEVSVRIPESLWEFEQSLRSTAGEFFTRGKLDVAERVQRTSEPDYNVRVNSKLANSIIPQIRSILEEQGMAQPITGGDLMRIPNLLEVEAGDGEWDESEQQALQALVREAFGQILQMRKVEGEGLARDLITRLDRIGELRSVVESGREEVSKQAIDAFRQRVGDIARTAAAEVSEERIAQEIVLMLERGDVAEEITRLGLHVDQFRAAISSDEAGGKRLDFLTQEMLREINTLGSKSRSSSIRSAVVELKTELERIREQVQNVE